MNTLEKIKILREKTGISIIECKKALIKNNEDLNKSLEYLKETNFLNIEKVINKTEGMIWIEIDMKIQKAVIIEVNCATDFTAKSIDFKTFVKEITAKILNDDKYEEKYSLNPYLDFDIETKKNNLISKFKENIVINRFCKIKTSNEFINSYIHLINNQSKIASIVIFDKFENQYKEIYDDIAMQVTAMKPRFVDNKENNINKITNKDIFLLEQDYIKNSKIKIKELIKDKFKILKFIRFEIGEENISYE